MEGVILYHLCLSTYRFSGRQRMINPVTQRTLTKQLRELESDGLVARVVYPEVPSKQVDNTL